MPEAGEKAGPEVIRTGELSLPLIAAALQSMVPTPSLDSTAELTPDPEYVRAGELPHPLLLLQGVNLPWRYRRAHPGGEDRGELMSWPALQLPRSRTGVMC